MPRRTLSQVDKILIEKRRQLTAGEKGVYWALAKRKKVLHNQRGDPVVVGCSL